MGGNGLWRGLALGTSLAMTACGFDFDRYDPAQSTGDAHARDGAGSDGTSGDWLLPIDDAGPACGQGSLDMAAQCGIACRDALQPCLSSCHSNECAQGCQDSLQTCIATCVTSCTDCTGPDASSHTDCADAAGPSSVDAGGLYDGSHSSQ
jgi:hypothetical protein